MKEQRTTQGGITTQGKKKGTRAIYGRCLGSYTERGVYTFGDVGRTRPPYIPSCQCAAKFTRARAVHCKRRPCSPVPPRRGRPETPGTAQGFALLPVYIQHCFKTSLCITFGSRNALACYCSEPQCLRVRVFSLMGHAVRLGSSILVQSL